MMMMIESLGIDDGALEIEIGHWHWQLPNGQCPVQHAHDDADYDGDDVDDDDDDDDGGREGFSIG